MREAFRFTLLGIPIFFDRSRLNMAIRWTALEAESMEYKADPKFREELESLGGVNASLCFQCGTCTAGCPSGRRTSYRVRKLVRMAQLDMKDEIINSEELWMCSTCYTCVERCPRRVPIVDIIVALRNMAVADGKIKPAHRKTASNFYSIGHTVDCPESIMKTRESIGLPAVPPTCLSNPAAYNDLKTILDAVGFDGIAKE